MSHVAIFIIAGIVFTITLGLLSGILITEKLCMYGWKQFIITTLIALVIGFGISGLITLKFTADEKEYNDGYCECGGEWELFDIERGYRNGNTIYYYKCNNCKDVIETYINLK